MDSLEGDFLIQGCTAIEDKLQDDVAWTIDYFIKSGKLLKI
jgi:magnesium-transporting ATPase (P-type)